MIVIANRGCPQIAAVILVMLTPQFVFPDILIKERCSYWPAQLILYRSRRGVRIYPPLPMFWLKYYMLDDACTLRESRKQM